MNGWGQQMASSTAPTKRFPLVRVAALAGLLIAIVVLAFTVFPDAFINGYIKDRNIKAFERAFPAYTLKIGDLHYGVWANRLECDSVELRAVDSRFSCRLGAVSLGSVGWIELLRGKALKSENFESSKVIVQKAWLDYPKTGYELRVDRLSISVPDSSIKVDSLEIRPVGGDEAFFARSATRTSRYTLTIPRGRVMGSDCRGVIDAKIFSGRDATIEDPSLDILVNNDKPAREVARSAMIPNEILTSIKQTLQVESLSVVNASIRYGERFAVGAPPATITLDDFDVAVGGLGNVSESKGAAVIRAEGRLMKSGRVKMVMAIPLATPEFSFRYTGSIGPMDVTRFNAYLEPAQRVRLASGDLEEASFDIEVNSGHATGTVRAIYTDLNIAVLDKKSGSASGFKNRLTSFLANKLKIRNDNVPDKSGDLEIGRVDYVRKPGDALFKFLWLALRSGVADVAGF